MNTIKYLYVDLLKHKCCFKPILENSVEGIEVTFYDNRKLRRVKCHYKGELPEVDFLIKYTTKSIS